MTATSTQVAWTRLIRFIPRGASNVVYGEPVGSDAELADIGATADAGKLTARVVQVGAEGPLAPSAKVTDEVLPVGQLLGRLAVQDVPEVKAIGLNYAKHSEFGV